MRNTLYLCLRINGIFIFLEKAEGSRLLAGAGFGLNEGRPIWRKGMVMKAHAINLRILPNPEGAVHPFSSGNIAGEQYMTAKLDTIHERSSEETPAGDEKTATRLTDRLIGTLSGKLTRLEGPKIDKGILDGLRMLAEWVQADRSFLCFLAGENRKISDVRERGAWPEESLPILRTAGEIPVNAF